MEQELIPTPPPKSTAVEKIIADAHDDSALKDFEFVRTNLHSLVENGKTAVEELVDLATRSSHPQVYAVLAKFIDTMVMANKAILEEQAKIRELRDITVKHNNIQNSQTNYNQTAVFVGSTADFQRSVHKIFKNLENKTAENIEENDTK